MLNKLMALREEERQRLAANPALTLGDVTTVNLTIMEGGVQARVQHENLFSNVCGNS
jgi:aminoacylase